MVNPRVNFMKPIYCLTFLILTACGQQSPQNVTVDPALVSYVTSFETNIGASMAGINIEFANTEGQANPLGETVGECVVYSDGSKTIRIDQTYWNNSDESQRMQLFLHEGGHCALNMNYHITTLQADDCPTSIMYPYTFGDSLCYTQNEGYYYNELASHK